MARLSFILSSAVRLSLAFLALTAACSGPSAPADGGAPDGATTIDGIAAPALPALTPCPDGWREVALPEGVTVCDPWPEGGPADCPDGQAHFPGGGGCEPVGPACGDDDFATDLPSDRTVFFVSARPGTGGTGTRADPFHDLADAFRAASGGEVFALGRGTHTIEAVFPDEVTLWGACTAETRVVAGFADGVTGTITSLEQGRLELRNVTIEGSQPGIRVQEESAVVAENVIIAGSGISAIWVIGASTFEGRNVVVRDTAGDADGNFGRAVSAEGGATVRVTRGAFERTREIAVQMVDDGTSLTLEDVVIRDNRTQAADALWGRAIEIGPGASASLARVALEGNLEYGLYVGGAGASATIVDSVARGTREATNGETGRGLHVQEGASLTARRVWVEDNREIGVYGSGMDGGQLTLEDVVVRGTRQRRSDGVGGRGIQVQWGVTVDATRVLAADNEENGVFVATDPTVARFTDLTVIATRPLPDIGRGRGVEVLLGADVELTRARIDGNTDIGIFADGAGTVLRIADVAVLGTRAVPESGVSGRGVSLQDGSHLEGERVRVYDNLEIGVYVSASTLELADVRVERTGQQACAADGCSGLGRGFGLASVAGGVAALRDFRLADNALAGIYLAADGEVTLADGEVASHPIGIHAGMEDIDFETQVRDVAFVDNERNVDATSLPLPDPALPGEVDL